MADVADTELANLLVIIGSGLEALEPPSQVPPTDLVPLLGDGGGGGDVPDDVAVLVRALRVAHGPVKREFQQRSEELMEHARYALYKKRRQVEMEVETGRRLAAEEKLQLVAAYFPAISSSLGMKAASLARSPAMGAIHVKLAATPRIAGSANQLFAMKQDRSARLVADVLLNIQSEFVSVLFSTTVPVPLEAGSRLIPARVPSANKIGCVSLQWDETSQRLRAICKRLLPGLRQPTFSAASQVMVFSGSVMLWTKTGTGDGIWKCTETHPYFNRSVRLAGQSAEFILEALLKLWPLNILDPCVAEQIDRDHEVFIITISCDRASANFKAISYLIGEVLAMKLPRILIHTEPCGLHGVAIVKSRSPPLKKMGAAFYSLTRWLRVYSNMTDLTTAVHAIIEGGGVVVLDAQRPANLKRDGLALIEHLYGQLDSPFLWTFSKRLGSKVKTNFHKNLLALVDTIDLCAKPEGGSLTFYNRVSADSDAHIIGLLPIGAVIYQTQQECNDQVSIVVLNILTGRGWLDATESRFNDKRNAPFGCWASPC
jgi:hypothetical protein